MTKQTGHLGKTNMLLRNIFENLARTGKAKSAVLGWGRGMGHKGHMFLASSVITQAKEHNSDPYFVVSNTVGKDDPIQPDEKMAIYKKVFPQSGHIFHTATEEMPGLVQVLAKLQGMGYTDVTVVVGADQVKAMQFVTNYNGKPDKAGNIPFTFNTLNVISRQETNDPSRDQEGPRATPMRAVLMDPAKSEEEKFAVWRDAMNPELSDEEVMDLMHKAEQRMKAMVKPKKKGVVEGAMDELHADLSDKYNELAPGIEKYKDEKGADNLYRELLAIAKQHGAEREFSRMCNGARNSAHMDYDTNPGHFKNWFWYLGLGDDQGVREGIVDKVRAANYDRLSKRSYNQADKTKPGQVSVYDVNKMKKGDERDTKANKLKGVAEVKQRLDPKCWTGKHKEGTKMKGGVRVNNCVPNEGISETPIDGPNDNPMIYGHQGVNPAELKTRMMRARGQLKDLAQRSETDNTLSWETITRQFPELAMNIEQIRHAIEELAKKRKKGGIGSRGIDPNIGEEMMSANKFTKGPKNKLGPAAHLKATDDHAKAGDFVGENWELAKADALSKLIESQLK